MKALQDMDIEDVRELADEVSTYDDAIQFAEKYSNIEGGFDIEMYGAYIMKQKLVYEILRRRMSEVGVFFPDSFYVMDSAWDHVEPSQDEYVPLCMSEGESHAEYLFGVFVTIMESYGWQCDYDFVPSQVIDSCYRVVDNTNGEIDLYIEQLLRENVDYMDAVDRDMQKRLTTDVLMDMLTQTVEVSSCVAFRNVRAGRIMSSIEQGNIDLPGEMLELYEQLLSRISQPLYRYYPDATIDFLSDVDGAFVFTMASGECVEICDSVSYSFINMESLGAIPLFSRIVDMIYERFPKLQIIESLEQFDRLNQVV